MSDAAQKPIRKVVIISGDYPPVQSGEAGHALHLARVIAARGIEVTVLTSRIENVPHDSEFTVEPIMDDWTWSSVPRIVSFLRRKSPDAVLMLYLDGMYGSHAMMTFLPSIARAVVPNARFLTQFEHIGRMNQTPTFRERLIRRSVATLLGNKTVNYGLGTLLRDSDQVIALNEPQRNTLIEEWPACGSRMSLIPPPPLMRVVAANNGASRARGRKLLGLRDDELAVLYYGYMYPGKGIETLLEAAKQASLRVPSLRLVLAGEILSHALGKGDTQCSASYKQELQDKANQLGFGDRIIWTGACSPDGEEGSLYMWGSDLCVLPFDKGIQLNNSTFAAAASHSLPIVTTRGAQIENAFVHGTNVCLCAPLDPNAMAASIVNLLHDAAERRSLSTGATQLARELFSWDRAVDRTLELMQSPRKVA